MRFAPLVVADAPTFFGLPLAATAMSALALGCGLASPSEPSASTASAVVTTLQNGDFSDANGWNQPPYYSTIRFPDVKGYVNGTSLSDVCGRGIGGIWCATDDGSGALTNDTLWSSAFSDANGWNAPQYYGTIAFPNVDGDSQGRADVCGRGPQGIWCGLSNGASFSQPTLWSASFSDANGWNAPQYYETISFADLNGDGRADVCGRGTGGVWCALSNGTSSFGAPTLWNASFSDANGWSSPQYYSTIRLPDVNGDGMADVCGRGPGGIWCALSSGGTFGATTLWNGSFSDANGWAAPQYDSTIQYSDIDGNGTADVCARGAGGLLCALSSGTTFGGATVWNASFSDANGWAAPSYYSTIRVVAGTVCGRGVAGLSCAFSNATNSFNGLILESPNESDANGWTQPQYYSTIALTPDLKLAERGAAGIYTGKVARADNLSINTAADANARRTALITKVWGQGTIDTSQSVDSDTTPATIDVQPLPAGVAVHRYVMNMPTSGGSPVAGGPALVQGLADHYIPSGGSTKLAIVNPGHTCDYGTNYQDSQMVFELLAEGYAVLATYMPLYTPLQCTGNHNALFDRTKSLRPAGGLNPISYFLDPVRRSLNYAIAKYGYTTIDMVGLSGGGWTTTFYPALDTRVTTSVAIAGSEPFYMRPTADAEQENVPVSGNDFFDFTVNGSEIFTGYKDLYVLAAFGAGRRHTQVLNRDDDCCFGQGVNVDGVPQYLGGPLTWDHTVRAYELEVRQHLQALGAGAYRVEINEADDCVAENNCGSGGPLTHEFSKNTRTSVVFAEFDGAASFVGVPASGGYPFARGVNGDLWHDGGPGVGWIDTGLAMVGTPAVVTGAIAGHTFDLFYRDPFNMLTHAYYCGTSWVATADLSARVLSDPAAVSWGPGRIDVVALETEYQPYHWAYAGSWSPGVSMGSVLGVGQVAATSAGPGHFDVLFRAINSTTLLDEGLYHAGSNGAAPYALEATGTFIKGFPSATSSGGALSAYATGSDNQLYRGEQVSGAAWSWLSLSGATGSTSTAVLGSPSAFLAPSGTASVYARIQDGTSSQIAEFVLVNGAWTLEDEAGSAMEGSPAANGTGVFSVDAASQAGWELGTQGWQGLGGDLNR